MLNLYLQFLILVHERVSVCVSLYTYVYIYIYICKYIFLSHSHFSQLVTGKKGNKLKSRHDSCRTKIVFKIQKTFHNLLQAKHLLTKISEETSGLPYASSKYIYISRISLQCPPTSWQHHKGRLEKRPPAKETRPRQANQSVNSTRGFLPNRTRETNSCLH